MNGNIKGVIFNAALIVFLKAIILFYTEFIFDTYLYMQKLQP